MGRGSVFFSCRQSHPSLAHVSGLFKGLFPLLGFNSPLCPLPPPSSVPHPSAPHLGTPTPVPLSLRRCPRCLRTAPVPPSPLRPCPRTPTLHRRCPAAMPLASTHYVCASGSVSAPPPPSVPPPTACCVCAPCAPLPLPLLHHPCVCTCLRCPLCCPNLPSLAPNTSGGVCSLYFLDSFKLYIVLHWYLYMTMANGHWILGHRSMPDSGGPHMTQWNKKKVDRGQHVPKTV